MSTLSWLLSDAELDDLNGPEWPFLHQNVFRARYLMGWRTNQSTNQPHSPVLAEFSCYLFARLVANKSNYRIRKGYFLLLQPH